MTRAGRWSGRVRTVGVLALWAAPLLCATAAQAQDPDGASPPTDGVTDAPPDEADSPPTDPQPEPMPPEPVPPATAAPAPTQAAPAPAPTQAAPAPAPASAATQPAPPPPTVVVAPPPSPPVAPAPVDGPATTQPEEEDDSSRHYDVLWLEGTFGYSYIDLAQFRQDNFLPSSERLSGSGYVGGAALGFRVKLFTAGVRVTVAKYDEFDLGNAMLDLALRIPASMFDPYVRFGIGYAWMTDNGFEAPRVGEADVFGLITELGLGLDIYINDYLALGFGIDAALLNLTRQDLRDCMGDGDCRFLEFNLDENGDSLGLQLRAQVHLSLHL